MGSLSRRGHHGNGPTSEGATGAERANTMIGLQIMMPAGSWPPVPVRASSRHTRSWGDSGHAGHIGGTAALDPNRSLAGARLHAGKMKYPACSPPVQSALMLAARITFPHFCVSSAISLPKSAAEPDSTMPPRSASRAFILGSARAALISLLSLAMISKGVFLGAPTPYHVLASYPGSTSATVGKSGSASERVAVVTASARNLPDLTYSIADGIGSNVTCTC